MKRNVVVTLVTLGVLPVLASQRQSAVHFDTLEVAPFTVSDGVHVPAGYTAELQLEIVKQMSGSKDFGTVRPQNSDESDSGGTRLVLTGVVTQFHAGTRAGRIIGSIGLAEWAATGGGKLGAAKAVAHISFVDTATGKVLLERDVAASLKGNPMSLSREFTGGNSRDTGAGLALKIAKLCKSSLKR